MPVSCRIHAGFMHLYTYAEFMSDSCRIQLNSVLPFIYIDLRRFHAGFMPDSCIYIPMPNSCQIHAGFSWIQFSIHLHWPTLFSCRFHAGFMHLYTYAEFMSDSCRIQLNSALPFIHVDLCRFHAVFNHSHIYLHSYQARFSQIQHFPS